MNIEYTVQIWKEGNQHIAHATPLDVVSSGQTQENAKAALREAVHLFLDTALEMGTLEDILKECGYEFRGNDWISPPWICIEKQSMAVGA